MKNIVLVGFMGTGKSSVGRVLARRLKREFVDIDRYIETQQNCSIREIFETRGEPAFRALEKEAVAFWAPQENKVITTGGGTVIDSDNYDKLKANGVLITLIAKPETIFERVKNSKHRPLLNDKSDLLSEIKTILEKRMPYYNRSDFYFDTDGKNSVQVARMIQNVVLPKLV